ncbi:unnamed protein product [Camellia sinensis]
MDTAPATTFQNLKRYLRRRRYQRLDNTTNNKRMKITRLGSGSKNRRRVWKIRLSPKLRFKVALPSPMKLLAKFHEAYVGMMVRMVGDNDIDLFGGKRIPKGRSLPMMVSSSDEIVDGKLVLEIYKRLVSSHELSSMLV